MKIIGQGKVGDQFSEELKANMEKLAKKDDKNVNKKMDEEREKVDQPHEEGTLEVILEDDRTKEPAALPEAKLKEERKKNNSDLSGTIEKRLNDASKKNYPHRNPEAWERTGDKRPINALDEEMGAAGDAAKLKRYEAASKASQGSTKRVVDKAAFNLKKKIQANEKVKGYLEYKSTKQAASKIFEEVKAIDAMMASIMEEGLTKQLSTDDMAKIAALKTKKSELLGIK